MDETRDVHVPTGAGFVVGELVMPRDAAGVIVIAHGSGSNRFSSRNLFVAQALRRRGFATFLIDLLTATEARIDQGTAHLRFDVELLATRVMAAVDALERTPARGSPVGLYGASTGAAAALIAAARRKERIVAIVSRGGRPDLAGPDLDAVRAPTLLLVGSADPEVLALNEAAFATLSCPKRLAVVPGAGHLFAEPGTLDVVAREAADWFERWIFGARIVRDEVRPSAASVA
jgi:alpha-beta hydrolase superfamily lysophospholipase